MQLVQNRSLREAVDMWCEEDSQILQMLSLLEEQLDKWRNNIRFGELFEFLSVLRRKLVLHFVHEGQLNTILAKQFPSSSPEIHAIFRQSRRDRHDILRQIDHTLRHVCEAESCGWVDVHDQVNRVIMSVERHEDHHALAVGALAAEEMDQSVY